MIKTNFVILMAIFAFLFWSCEETSTSIADSELPKYILSPADISNNNSQIIWKITILDSVVTKRQLLALATKMKDNDNQKMAIVTIHFYPNGVKKDIASQVSVFYNKNEALKKKDLNGNPCEIEIRTETYQASGLPTIKITD